MPTATPNSTPYFLGPHKGLKLGGKGRKWMSSFCYADLETEAHRIQGLASGCPLTSAVPCTFRFQGAAGGGLGSSPSQGGVMRAEASCRVMRAEASCKAG